MSQRQRISQMETENEKSYKIRGAIFNVYNHLGPGLLESAYEVAMRIELEKMGCKVETQVCLPIVYEGVTIPNAFRIDMLVDDKVIVEFKAVASMQEVFFSQLMTYLKLSGKKLGILVNFKTTDISKSIYRRVNNL